jgi:hypothetical protein
MTTKPVTADVIRQKLVDLEDALELPQVAGELIGWTARVAASVDDVRNLLTAHLASAHRADYAEMINQDPELSTCVENLKAEDAAIRREFDRVWELATSLAAAAVRVEPDELTLAKARNRLVTDGLAVILRIRKQEAAVRTWYIEAFQRDRGVGD